MSTPNVEVSLLDFTPTHFNVEKLNDSENELHRILKFDFGISPDSTQNTTHFIIDITNEVHQNAKVLLSNSTRSTYQLINFSVKPNLAILEEYVFKAFESHKEVFSAMIKDNDDFKNEVIKQLQLEHFEESLRQQFLKSFPNS